MGILKFFRGKPATGEPPAGPPASAKPSFQASSLAPSMFATSGGSAPSEQMQHAVLRKDLLRIALRDVLERHGIPASWLDVQVQITASRSQGNSLQARILVKHWHPQLLAHAHGLEQELRNDLIGLDPGVNEWLSSVAWQLALPADTAPAALPKRSYWSLPLLEDPPAAPAQEWATTQPQAQASGDVIAGPVRIGTQDARAQLEQMLAEGDSRVSGAPAPSQAFAPTQPSPLH